MLSIPPPWFSQPEWWYFLHAILPFVEQDNLYQLHANYEKACWAGGFKPWGGGDAAWPVAATDKFVPAYLCPSDGMGGKWMVVTPTVHMFKVNYLGFFPGYSETDVYYDVMGPANLKLRTLFGMNRSSNFGNMIDGTSNTLVVGEYLTGPSENHYYGVPISNRAFFQFIFALNGPNSTVPDVIYPPFCANLPEANLPCIGGGVGADTVASRSRHPGGVQGLLGDGSVHFFGNTIDLATWRSLVFMANGGITTGF